MLGVLQEATAEFYYRSTSFSLDQIQSGLTVHKDTELVIQLKEREEKKNFSSSIEFMGQKKGIICLPKIMCLLYVLFSHLF